MRTLTYDKPDGKGGWISSVLHITFAQLQTGLGGGQGPASESTVKRAVRRLSDLGLICAPDGGPVRVSERRPHHPVALVVPVFPKVDTPDGTFRSAPEIRDALPAVAVLNREHGSAVNPDPDAVNPDRTRHPAMDAHIVTEPDLTSGNGPVIPGQRDNGSAVNPDRNVVNLDRARLVFSQVRGGEPQPLSSSLLSPSSSEARDEGERERHTALASAGAPPDDGDDDTLSADARYLLSEIPDALDPGRWWHPDHAAAANALCASLTAKNWTPGEIAVGHARRAADGPTRLRGYATRAAHPHERLIETLTDLDVRNSN